MIGDPAGDDAADPVIPHDEIRERAYDLWDRNHRPNGYELEFWLMAERELKAERRSRLERDAVSAEDQTSRSTTRDDLATNAGSPSQAANEGSDRQHERSGEQDDQAPR
jgi:hypothetical protein